MKILVSALSRYHLFDLATQLQRYDALGELVSAYPRFKLGQYAHLEKSLISLSRFAIMQKASLSLANLIGARRSAPLNHRVYSAFAGAVAGVASKSSSRIVYGLSGYMQEVIARCGLDKINVVDHGSLHIETERRIMKEECAQYGFAEFGNWQHDWLVDRMNHEFENADHVVCCSDLAKQSMIDNGVDAKKIFVNRLGVNLSDFRPEKGHSGDGIFRILFVGAMTPLKGLHYLLEAFHKMPAQAELWLVGALPTDPLLKKMLDECVIQTGRVRVFGPVAQSRLKAIYNQCDLFVLPSLSDGWGMVVSQALACGLPVIVSDMTGAKEAVEQHRNGLVIKSGNLCDLTEKMEFVIEKSYSFDHGEPLSVTDSGSKNPTWSDYGDRSMEWLSQINS